ncbi:MAG: hypothetical protein EZS28_033114, partial [Streblomastix strix]
MQTDSELDIRYEQLSCPSLMDLDIQFVDEGRSEQGQAIFSFQNTGNAPWIISVRRSVKAVRRRKIISYSYPHTRYSASSLDCAAPAPQTQVSSTTPFPISLAMHHRSSSGA